MFSYTFELITEESYWERISAMESRTGGPSKIYDIINHMQKAGDYATEMSLIYGKLQGLFGKCACESENLEEQYTYYVSTRNEAEEPILLYVYSGPSGPSIGGFGDEESLKAAKALAEIIWNAEPADYDYKGYYFDFGTEIKMGIRDGVPYYEESGGIDPTDMGWLSNLPEEVQEELRQLGLDREPDWE